MKELSKLMDRVEKNMIYIASKVNLLRYVDVTILPIIVGT